MPVSNADLPFVVKANTVVSATVATITLAQACQELEIYKADSTKAVGFSLDCGIAGWMTVPAGAHLDDRFDLFSNISINNPDGIALTIKARGR